jgi:ubiquinone/menaquinone biosynthesis C-methylase UbiE/DNA-binding transcriptional ArsR family regulator
MNMKAAQNDKILGQMAGLADPVRLRLLRLVESRELGVADLCDVLQLPQSTVSRHLKSLSDLHLLASRSVGTNNLYRVNDELDTSANKLWLLAREQTGQWPATAQDQLRLNRLLHQRNGSKQFFAGAAGQWDKLRGALYGQTFSIAAGLALLPRTHVVADLGCGSGPIAASIAPFVARVIGVDNSPAMLRAAKRSLAGRSNIELRRGDLASLPIDDATCDAALLVLALTYVADPSVVIHEMSRILKPGGTAAVIDLLPHGRDDFRREMRQRWRGFESSQIRQWMNEAHLDISALRPLPPEKGVKGPALFLATGEKAST